RSGRTGSSAHGEPGRWSCTRSPTRAERCSPPSSRHHPRIGRSSVPEPGGPLLQLGQLRAPSDVVRPVMPDAGDRAALEQRARRLGWLGISWHVLEFAVAIAAGIAAGSIALIGFGADSMIEALAGAVVLWLFTGSRRGSHAAERRAQQFIAASFFVLAAYIAVESARSLARGDHPPPSSVRIGCA